MAQNMYDDDEFFAGLLRPAAQRARAGRCRRVARHARPAAAARRGPGARPRVRVRLVLPVGAGAGCGRRCWASTCRRTCSSGPPPTPTTRPSATSRPTSSRSTLPATRSTSSTRRSPCTTWPTWTASSRQMAAAVVPGGAVVCSVEHPIYTRPVTPGVGRGRRSAGVAARRLLATGRGHRLARARRGEAAPHHRHHVAAFAAAGLRLTALVEWAPDDAELRGASRWEEERDRPHVPAARCTTRRADRRVRQ